MQEMKDFKGKELFLNDKVIFIFDKFGSNELKEGIITKLNIKQAKYTMIEVEWFNMNNVKVNSNVSLKKVYKL